MILVLMLATVSCTVDKVDIVLLDGKIFTSDTSQLYVEALAIKGNKIFATGSTEEIQTYASADTRRITLNGKTVVPGFNDAHDHPGWGMPIGQVFTYAEMNPAGLSKAAVLDSVARLVKTANADEWISGFIGTSVLFDTSMRAALDRIAPNNPVALDAWWGHGTIVNEQALEAAGLSDSDSDPLGGWYVRNGSNKINALHENAAAPVWFALNNSAPDKLVNGLRAFAQEQIERGITTIQYMGTGLKEREALRVFSQADLPQRVRLVAWPLSTSHGRVLSEWSNHGSDQPSLTYVSGIKYVIDGTPLEENSLNKKPYGQTEKRFGRLNYPVDTIRQILREALTSNHQLILHITGDSSMAIVLSLMKQLAGREVWRSKRVRIEHNATADITPSEVDAVNELGLLMMHTPKYCQASPIRSLIQKGIVVGISPDGTTNPFHDIMLVTSQQIDPEENITREQAVIAYTKTNAYAEFAEEEKGTLAIGMLADLAVLSQDIFTVPSEQLPATKSVLTIVNGNIVHRAPD